VQPLIEEDEESDSPSTTGPYIANY